MPPGPPSSFLILRTHQQLLTHFHPIDALLLFMNQIWAAVEFSKEEHPKSLPNHFSLSSMENVMKSKKRWEGEFIKI